MEIRVSRLLQNSFCGTLFLALALGFFSSSSVAWAYSLEAYPGSFWNSATDDFNNLEGYGDIGILTQGAQWVTLPGGIPMVTYGSYRWRTRTLERTYYDANGPAVGVEFSKYFFKWGMEYEWQHYPSLSEQTQTSSVFLNWFKKVYFLGERFPTSSWGRVTSDFNGFEGVGTMGYLCQAVELATLPGGITLRTQAQYNWRFRENNSQYYNVHGPAVGLELGRDSVNLGVEYAWQHYTGLDERTKDFRLYLNWYFGWDLKSSSP